MVFAYFIQVAPARGNLFVFILSAGLSLLPSGSFAGGLSRICNKMLTGVMLNMETQIHRKRALKLTNFAYAEGAPDPHSIEALKKRFVSNELILETLGAGSWYFALQGTAPPETQPNLTARVAETLAEVFELIDKSVTHAYRKNTGQLVIFHDTPTGDTRRATLSAEQVVSYFFLEKIARDFFIEYEQIHSIRKILLSDLYRQDFLRLWLMSNLSSRQVDATQLKKSLEEISASLFYVELFERSQDLAVNLYPEVRVFEGQNLPPSFDFAIEHRDPHVGGLILMAEIKQIESLESVDSLRSVLRSVRKKIATPPSEKVVGSNATETARMPIGAINVHRSLVIQVVNPPEVEVLKDLERAFNSPGRMPDIHDVLILSSQGDFYAHYYRMSDGWRAIPVEPSIKILISSDSTYELEFQWGL